MLSSLFHERLATSSVKPPEIDKISISIRAQFLLCGCALTYLLQGIILHLLFSAPFLLYSSVMPRRSFITITFPPQNLIGNLSLTFFPYLNNSAGTGINAIAMNPNILFPQFRPSVSYIEGPASGSKAPKRHRRHVIPAIADAAYCGKQSIM